MSRAAPRHLRIVFDDQEVLIVGAASPLSERMGPDQHHRMAAQRVDDNHAALQGGTQGERGRFRLGCHPEYWKRELFSV